MNHVKPIDQALRKISRSIGTKGYNWGFQSSYIIEKSCESLVQHGCESSKRSECGHRPSNFTRNLTERS